MGEPWCFTPEQVARLTDTQIRRLYFAPRDENGRLLEPPSLSKVLAKEPELPNRETFIAEMLANFGETAEHWDSMYTEILKRQNLENGEIEKRDT